MIQKSFVMMKPDAVQRRLMGKILSRFEEKGLQIVACKLIQIDENLAKTLGQKAHFFVDGKGAIRLARELLSL